MKQFILKKSAAQYGRPWTDADADYVVLDNARQLVT
jgi:hypothetical protein